MSDLLIVFVVFWGLGLFALSRARTRTRRAQALSRSNARVVHEMKRIAVREPNRIIESVE